ncbi:Dbl homology domain-containing protein [Fennellomyces sp. T-0311]|nr:Dbl homology domain-containing protein [Fennellomyces sp. T-0311]
MSGAPPSPTVVVGEANNDNPYQHQGAYAIRRQQVPLPINISEDVKKSYVRQQLPVRKQSLAAAATAAKAVNAFYTHSKTSRHPSNASDESNNDPATPPPMSSPPSFFSRRKDKEEKHVSFHTLPDPPKHQNESLPSFSEEEEIDRVALDDKAVDDALSSHAEEDEEEAEEVEALVAPPQSQLAVVSPMAYETEDQQNAFFSHYVQSTNSSSALLSCIALELYKRIMPEDVLKDGVEFHYLFTGKEAVDHIADISQGVDRKRALMIGRTLESLDVYHGIDGERRFMDASSELYRFTALTIQRAKDGDTKLATGVFTSQTPCYSPTCSTDRPCYSNSCPKVKKRIKRTRSQYARPEKRSSRALWIYSVPKLVIATTPPEERKRQECIYELIYTEEDFAKDLDYVNNSWIKPLSTSDIVMGPEKRELLVQQIFWNIEDIEKISKALSGALVQRRKEQDVVDMIGDVMMAFVYQFEPYVTYGSHQVIGKYYFELEKRRNTKFALFVKETERKPESKRLELNGYLTKPTTRLGRYNLLLREILKRTPQGNPDREIIPQVMDAIAKLLERVNEETGRVERSFTLQQIEERLSFKSTSIFVDLKLRDADRELVMQGKMKRKGHSSSEDIQVFLFDHYLVLSKIKHHNHIEHFKISRKVKKQILLNQSQVVHSQGLLFSQFHSMFFLYLSLMSRHTGAIDLQLLLQ